MIYSETAIGRANILNDMYVLNQDENSITLSDICIKESKRLGENLISLEELCDFVIKNNINFDYLLNEISYINGIDINSIGFTVYPITLYENDLIYDLALELQEEGKNIFIASNPRTDISYAFDLIIESCIKQNSIEPLNYIAQVCFNESEPGDTTDVLAQSLRAGLKNAASGALNTEGFGRIFDTYERRNDGSVKTIHNGRILNAFGNHTTMGQAASDVVSSIRNGLSDHAIDKAEILLQNVMAGRRNPNEAINKIDASINNLNTQTQKNPQKRSIFRMIIDKLISIKNRILAWLRGHKH